MTNDPRVDVTSFTLTITTSPTFTFGLCGLTKFKCSPVSKLYPKALLGLKSFTLKRTVLPSRTFPAFNAASASSAVA